MTSLQHRQDTGRGLVLTFRHRASIGSERSIIAFSVIAYAGGRNDAYKPA
jgi:hypothetical protein